MSGLSVRIRLPPTWLFGIPPDPNPLTLPPPEDQRTFAAPFGIDSAFYNGSLQWKVPVTIASIYAVTVMLLNKWNRSRGNKPWWISKTRVFFVFVILHNVLLAIFSALVCWGMLRALAHIWPGSHEYYLFGKPWPGIRTKNGLAGAADALCKIHGPRGFGDGVYYNPEAQMWEKTNPAILLSANGTPDPTDVGRLWNEGLAFWGFWFYLSKFYEVLDTFIIIAKGKRSSTLQTYHHTGAMLCMWAGIRFMSPPIWMFAFINSLIHTLMVCLCSNVAVTPNADSHSQYTYYTLTSLSLKVPHRIKRTLTTMQIMQFLIGFTFAAAHLFIEYTVPVSTPYTITSTLTSIVSAASSVASQAATEVSSVAVASTPVAAWLKKLAFRAAGEEGLAENVLNDQGSVFGPEVINQQHIIETVQQSVKYRIQYQTVSCIDTQGEAFAIYLNLLYLAPLTFLFVRFFVRSYLRRIDPKTKGSTRGRRLSQAAQDAAMGVDREFDSLGKSAEDGVGDLVEGLRRTASGSMRPATPSSSQPGTVTPSNGDRRRVSAAIERLGKKFEDSSEVAVEETNDSLNKVKSNGSAKAIRKKASEDHERLRNMWEEGMEGRSPTEGAPDAVGNVKDSIASAAETAKATAQEPASEVVSKLEDVAEAAASKAKQVVNGADEPKSVVDDLTESARNGANPSPNLESRESKGTDASWENIQSSHPSLKREDSTLSSTSSQKGGESGSTVARAESPVMMRVQSSDRNNSSPARSSRIPRPKDSGSSSRSRSPVKKSTVNGAGRSTTPRTNGAAFGGPIKEDDADADVGAHTEHDATHLLGVAEDEPTFAEVVKDDKNGKENGES